MGQKRLPLAAPTGRVVAPFDVTLLAPLSAESGMVGVFGAVRFRDMLK